MLSFITMRLMQWLRWDYIVTGWEFQSLGHAIQIQLLYLASGVLWWQLSSLVWISMKKIPDYLLFQKYFRLVDIHSVYPSWVKIREGKHWDYGYSTLYLSSWDGTTPIAPWLLSLSAIFIFQLTWEEIKCYFTSN